MAVWKELINKSDISYDELKLIPGASCENYIAMKNYFMQEYGFKEEDLLRGLSMSPEEFNNPKNWINSRDEQLFHINLFISGRDFFTHYDYVEAGRYFRFSNNSLFMIFFKAMSAGRIIKEIEKNVRKFNNEYTIDPVYFKNGEAYLIQKDYPFYNESSVGGECRFTEGVWKANFEVHDISHYTVEHIICSKKLENLINYGYNYCGFKVTKDENYLYINGKPAAEYVELAVKKIGSRSFFTNKTVNNGLNKNALRVIDNIHYKGRLLIKKGEIYNAPYCLFHLAWKEHSLIQRIINASKGKNLLLKSLSEIEKQIEFTNLQLFELKQALSESERRLKIMELYTKNSLIRKIESGEDPSGFTPEQKSLAVLFSDIRNFTSISEYKNPLEVVLFLNEYYTQVNEVITRNNGEIDKLIGDAVMASFNESEDSLISGLEMKKTISEYNRKLISLNKPTINIGLGITYGNVILGNIGSHNKLDFTMIGDTVNTSSRIEALTKEYKVGFLISESLKNSLNGDYKIRFVDRVKVRGKNKPIAVYEVFDYERDDIISLKLKIQPELDKAYEYYSGKNFTAAEIIYRNLLENMDNHHYIKNLPADPLVLFYHKRIVQIIDKIEKGIINPDIWDETYIAAEK